MDGIIPAVIRGVILGGLAALLGWAKNSDPGKFSYKGVLLKLPAGILVGLIASLQDIAFDEALHWASGVGLVEVCDKAVKALVRRWYPEWLVWTNGHIELDPETAEALIKISEAEKMSRDDVIRCTEAFRKVTAKILREDDPLDREFKQHLDLVWNQILQNARKEGWNAEAYETCGKLLFRLFKVWRQYRGNKFGMSPEEWAQEIKVVIELLQAAFEGK